VAVAVVLVQLVHSVTEQVVAERLQDLLLQTTSALQLLQVGDLMVVMVVMAQVKAPLLLELPQRLEITEVCTYHGN
jgi:hypothetical protein